MKTKRIIFLASKILWFNLPRKGLSWKGTFPSGALTGPAVCNTSRWGKQGKEPQGGWQQPHWRWHSHNPPLGTAAPLPEPEHPDLGCAAGAAGTAGTLSVREKGRRCSMFLWDCSVRARPEKLQWSSPSPPQLRAAACFGKIIPCDSVSYSQRHRLHLYLPEHTECSFTDKAWLCWWCCTQRFSSLPVLKDFTLQMSPKVFFFPIFFPLRKLNSCCSLSPCLEGLNHHENKISVTWAQGQSSFTWQKH